MTANQFFYAIAKGNHSWASSYFEQNGYVQILYLEDVSEIAGEGDDVPEAVVLPGREHEAVLVCLEGGAGLGHAGLVEAVGVAVAEAVLGLGDEEVGGAVLGEQLEAHVAHAVEAAGVVQAL